MRLCSNSCSPRPSMLSARSQATAPRSDCSGGRSAQAPFRYQHWRPPPCGFKDTLEERDDEEEVVGRGMGCSCGGFGGWPELASMSPHRLRRRRRQHSRRRRRRRRRQLDQSVHRICSYVSPGDAKYQGKGLTCPRRNEHPARIREQFGSHTSAWMTPSLNAVTFCHGI